MSAVRARRHIEAGGHDDYLIALHITGTAYGVQDGREVRLGPGDFALFDSSRPYWVTFAGPGAFEHVIYQVPRGRLDARSDVGDGQVTQALIGQIGCAPAQPLLADPAAEGETLPGEEPVELPDRNVAGPSDGLG